MTRTLEELRSYLVGEWLFNGNFRDTSGNENHGTPTNVEWVPTERGMKPIQNSDGKITTSNMDNIPQFTVMQWFKNTGHTAGWQKGFEHSSYGVGGFYYDLCSSIGSYKVTPYLTGTPSTSLGNYTYEPNEWVCIITSIDTINLTAVNMINGVVILETSINEDAWTPLDNRTISLMRGGSNMIIGETAYYSISFTMSEMLDLYNSTKTAYGIQPAERSFTHKLSPSVDENTVFATDMSTLNADGTLIDLSGNSNHGTVVGCGRAGGYFRDGMKLSTNNYLKVSDDDTLTPVSNKISLSALIKSSNNTTRIFSKQLTPSGEGTLLYAMDTINGYLRFFGYTDVSVHGITTPPEINICDLKQHLVTGTFDGTYWTLYVDGIEIMSKLDSTTFATESNYPLYIGARNHDYGYSDAIIQIPQLLMDIITQNEETERFNSLAVLQLYELDCNKIPVQEGLTDHIPYTSAIINSGEFDIVASEYGNQLVCVSSGEIVLQNAHTFDGSEYLTLTVDGDEYSGTGTITHGTVTASISQDSTAITVNMAAGDVLDKLDIQFRRPV